MNRGGFVTESELELGNDVEFFHMVGDRFEENFFENFADVEEQAYRSVVCRVFVVLFIFSKGYYFGRFPITCEITVVECIVKKDGVEENKCTWSFLRITLGILSKLADFLLLRLFRMFIISFYDVKKFSGLSRLGL